jgi:hypothetical protein
MNNAASSNYHPTLSLFCAGNATYLALASKKLEVTSWKLEARG